MRRSRSLGGITGSWAGTYVVAAMRRQQRLDARGDVHGAEYRTTGRLRARRRDPADHDGADRKRRRHYRRGALGTVRGTLTGKNRGAGYFYLTGVIEHAAGVVNISHWETQVQRDEMQGFINYQVRLGSLPGIGNAATRLVNMTRLASP